MNEEAYKERERNKQHIRSYRGRDLPNGNSLKVLQVDTENATYQGTPLRDLSHYHRRKFENLLVISEAPQAIHVVYR